MTKKPTTLDTALKSATKNTAIKSKGAKAPLVSSMTTRSNAALKDLKPGIGLTDTQRAAVIDLLHVHLSNLHVLYVKTRNYHWNVRGMRFAELHEFFEEQYVSIEASIDEFAERVRQVGGMTMGTMREFLEVATLKEQPGVFPDAQTMIQNLLGDHETIIRSMRDHIDATAEKFNDMGTSDFLTAKLQEHEKMAWMLRAHLNGES